jgi:imidazolonepropionase-like amidohydrolase
MDRVASSGWLILLVYGALGAETFVITGAAVVDGTGAAARAVHVVVEGERIRSVGGPIPAGARVINAQGHTLLPGLFDVHTHVSYASGPAAPADWPAHLKAYLNHGVTTVADFGTYAEAFEPMRRLVRDGKIDAPRVHYASRVTTPGGHGAEGGRGDFFSLEVLTPREARAAVERLLPYRPDAIKVFTDGWRYGGAPDMTSMEEATLAAIVEAAHKNGIEVLTHTVTLEQAKKAARAGVDVIAHGIGDADADDELLRLMKEKGVFYAPTLAVYEPRSASTATWRQKRWFHLLRNTALLRLGGVRFANGTDSGVTGTHHGKAALREMQLLVAAGLTPLEAIAASTGNSARALGVAGERGAISEGKLADLMLVEGAPHLNIGDIENVRRVFLGGREVDRAAPAPRIPAVHAHRSLDDFERPDGRSLVDTLWVNQTDSGHDKSRMSFLKVLREEGNHALMVIATMAQKERPFARVNLPLRRGAVEPVDATAFRGVQFEARGEGEYRFRVAARASAYDAPFSASGKRQSIRIPFQRGWDVAEITMLQFEIARKAGETAWLELDNIRFY